MNVESHTSTISRKGLHVPSTANFYFGQVIGEGLYSKVFHAKYKAITKDADADDFRRGEDRRLGKDDWCNGGHVAIKVMDKVDMMKRNKIFLAIRERKILTKLSSMSRPELSWIARLHFSFTDEQNLYMVQELCPSGTLKDLVYRHKSSLTSVSSSSSSSAATPSLLGISPLRYYAAQILCAIEFIHSHGIIHCDLKPENIMLMTDGRIKLVDFGCAMDIEKASHAYDPSPSAHHIEFQGTADYIPPEVIKGRSGWFKEDAAINHQSDEIFAVDLWSYGCLVYFMFVGQSPFHSKSDQISFQKILSFARYGDDMRKKYLSQGGGEQDVQSSILSQALQLFINRNALDLTRRLLVADPSRRLGWGDRSISPCIGEREKRYKSIRSHTFFQDFMWETTNIVPKTLNFRNDEPKCLQENIYTEKLERNINVNINDDQMVDGGSLPFDFFA